MAQRFQIPWITRTLVEVSVQWLLLLRHLKAHVIQLMGGLNGSTLMDRGVTFNVGVRWPLSCNVRLTTGSSFMERRVISYSRFDCESVKYGMGLTGVEVMKVWRQLRQHCGGCGWRCLLSIDFIIIVWGRIVYKLHLTSITFLLSSCVWCYQGRW